MDSYLNYISEEINYTIINSDKYKYDVKCRIQSYKGSPLIHYYTFSYDFKDYLEVFVNYEGNKPIKGRFTHLQYHSEDTINLSLLETEKLIKLALKHVNKEFPSIERFEFEDRMYIEYIQNGFLEEKPINPLKLAYFFIAYYSLSWYEARFNAYMKYKQRYDAFKQQLAFLNDPEQKLPFGTFLSLIGYSLSNNKIINLLECIYNGADTYRKMFNNIPNSRYGIIVDWINPFIDNFMTEFIETGWIIDVNLIDLNNTELKFCHVNNEDDYRICNFKKQTSL